MIFLTVLSTSDKRKHAAQLGAELTTVCGRGTRADNKTDVVGEPNCPGCKGFIAAARDAEQKGRAKA